MTVVVELQIGIICVIVLRGC